MTIALINQALRLRKYDHCIIAQVEALKQP